MGKLGVVIGLILLLGLVGAGVWYASAPGTPPKKVLSEQEMLNQISNEPSPLPANANFDDAVKYLKTLEPKFAAFRVGETYTLSKPCFGVINSQDVYEFARQLIRPKEPGFMQMHQKGKTHAAGRRHEIQGDRAPLNQVRHSGGIAGWFPTWANGSISPVGTSYPLHR